MKKLLGVCLLLFPMLLIGCTSTGENKSSEIPLTPQNEVSTDTVVQRVVDTGSEVPKYNQKEYDTSAIETNTPEVSSPTEADEDPANTDSQDQSGNQNSGNNGNSNGNNGSGNGTGSNDGEYSDYIFVGDSRFVGMEEALNGYVDEDVTFIAEGSQGLEYLKTVAPDLYELEGKTIIFNLGVNDLSNSQEYVLFYNSLPQSFLAKNIVCVMTVNPVDQQLEAENGYDVKNTDIANFNSILISGVRKDLIYIIDTNSYLMLEGYETFDGLHYTTDTSRKIFDYAIYCCEHNDFFDR